MIQTLTGSGNIPGWVAELHNTSRSPRVVAPRHRRFEKTRCLYRGADKSLARPTSRILFDGENIPFYASLVLYIYIYIYIYIVLIFLQL
jgi:hypothetical protein